jgi:septum formation protein
LLKELVPDFEALAPDVDEETYAQTDATVAAKDLAQAKANAVWNSHRDAVVIGADTVVALKISHLNPRDLSRMSPDLATALRSRRLPIGKPKSPADAIDILNSLSSRTHFVLTGVCVLTPAGATSFVSVTSVRWRRLSGEEIEQYVATGEPMDKAGAYGIQGGAKGFVERIDGSLSNVIGLPLEALRPILAAAGLALRS